MTPMPDAVDAVALTLNINGTDMQVATDEVEAISREHLNQLFELNDIFGPSGFTDQATRILVLLP